MLREWRQSHCLSLSIKDNIIMVFAIRQGVDNFITTHKWVQMGGISGLNLILGRMELLFVRICLYIQLERLNVRLFEKVDQTCWSWEHAWIEGQRTWRYHASYGTWYWLHKGAEITCCEMEDHCKVRAEVLRKRVPKHRKAGQRVPQSILRSQIRTGQRAWLQPGGCVLIGCWCPISDGQGWAKAQPGCARNRTKKETRWGQDYLRVLDIMA